MGHSFWARGCYVNSVCLDEGEIRKYIQDQEVSESIDKYDTDLSNPILRALIKLKYRIGH